MVVNTGVRIEMDIFRSLGELQLDRYRWKSRHVILEATEGTPMMYCQIHVAVAAARRRMTLASYRIIDLRSSSAF